MEANIITHPPGKLIRNIPDDIPRKKNDELLKGAFQDNFLDFLRFVYPDADQVLDLDKEIEFMDKELFSIIPDRERRKDKRVADLLAKLHLKDGKEKWVLLNVEIEGSDDAEFAERLFQYNYRIRDKYKVSVASIAVFTGTKTQKRQTKYQDESLGTVLSFECRSYHVFDHSEEALLKKQNPFALIALACQKALLEGKIPEEELNNHRLAIVKALIELGYSQERIKWFIHFIKNFIFIKDQNINQKFNEQLQTIIGGKINMGLMEVLKEWEIIEATEKIRLEKDRVILEERTKALEEKAKALEEKKQMIRNLKSSGISAADLAKSTGLSIEEIEIYWSFV